MHALRRACLALLLLAAGCSTFRPYTPPSVNPVCPVSGQPVARSIGAVEWDGHDVGFCSASCPETWSSWEDDARAMALRQAAHSHPGHSH